MAQVVKRTLLLVLIFTIVILIGHAMFPDTLKISTGISVWSGFVLADFFSNFFCYIKKNK